MDTDGRLLASSGDIDFPFFARSSVKPFQATVSAESGACLPPEWLALACSSHTGAPIHIATVREMLGSVGLSEDDLDTPADWPSDRNRVRLLRGSMTGPLPVYHNCSGKHAAFLRACKASGWDTAGNCQDDHPLQQRVRSLLADVTGQADFEVGVDGCGAPTFTVSVRTLALAFSRLGNDQRFDRVFSAMHRFPRLVSGMGKPDSEFAIHTHGVSKHGAEGSLGVAIRGFGSVAIKVLDGESRPIGPVVSDVLDQVGWLTPFVADSLRSATMVPMSGGGVDVGTVESVVRLNVK
jgi:L-asparaginase II